MQKISNFSLLKDLLVLTKDGEWGRSEPTSDSVEMYIIRGTDFAAVRYGNLSNVPIRYISEKIAERKSLQPNDILIETAGGTKEQPTGRTVFLKPRIFEKASLPITCASFSRFLRVNPQLAVPEYIYWYLQFLYQTGKMEQHQIQHTGVSRFQYTRFAQSVNIPLPSYSTQQRIVDILSTYDRLIDNNNRRIALLEESIHKLYKEWFVHLRFPGYESVKVVDGIPEGWERKQIKDFGTVVTGKTPSTKVTEYYGGNIPFIKTPDMHSQVFVVQTENSLTESGANSQSNKTIPAGTLMVSCIGTVGVVAISSTQSQTNQQINSLIFTNDIYRYYCYFALKSLKASLEAIGSNGATMANVNKHKFETMPLLLPKKSILIDFHHYATPAFKTILILQKENILVQQARDLLLPRLMNGSIAV